MTAPKTRGFWLYMLWCSLMFTLYVGLLLHQLAGRLPVFPPFFLSSFFFPTILAPWEAGSPPGAHTHRLKWGVGTTASLLQIGISRGLVCRQWGCGVVGSQGRGGVWEERGLYFCRSLHFLLDSWMVMQVQTILSQLWRTLWPPSVTRFVQPGRRGWTSNAGEKEFYSPKLADAYWLLISTKSLGFPKRAWKLWRNSLSHEISCWCCIQ